MPVIMESNVTFPGGTEGPEEASQQSSLERCFSSQVDCGQPAPKALRLGSGGGRQGAEWYQERRVKGSD